MSYYEKDLEKILSGMFFIELSNRLGKVIENVMGEKEEMYYIQIIGKDFNKTLCCKRVYLRTDLGILNVLTENNEYFTFDIKEVSYFDIEKPNAIRMTEIKNK